MNISDLNETIYHRFILAVCKTSELPMASYVYEGKAMKADPGETLKVRCKEEYKEDHPEITCQVDGRWSHPEPRCQCRYIFLFC